MSVSVTICDVGHGNCTLLREDEYSVLVDAAPGGIPEAVLRDAGITRVDEVIISHADDDHLGGLPSILRQFDVSRVWVNPDAARTTQAWDAARVAIREAQIDGRTTVRAGIGEGVELIGPNRRLSVKVVAPLGSELLWDTGDAPPDAPVNTANSLSAVVLVQVDGVSKVLLPGDAGTQSFQRLVDDGIDLRAPVLVFPHHGGRAGRDDPASFGALVAYAVEPDIVVFSVGRARSGFPRPEIISAIRQARPAAHVACTQLARPCSVNVPSSNPSHLSNVPAAGRSGRACCAGPIRITYSSNGDEVVPRTSEHSEFVELAAPTRMCR